MSPLKFTIRLLARSELMKFIVLCYELIQALNNFGII